MDLFGNRLARTIDYAATSTLTDEAFAYLYDDNDRLITETLDEGNNCSIDKTTTYTWNATNQLYRPRTPYTSASPITPYSHSRLLAISSAV